jgi:hypothetical protein
MDVVCEGGCRRGAVRYRMASAPFDTGRFVPGDELPRHGRSRPKKRGLEQE